jgi:hypothetical protein
MDPQPEGKTSAPHESMLPRYNFSLSPSTCAGRGSEGDEESRKSVDINTSMESAGSAVMQVSLKGLSHEIDSITELGLST